MDDGVKTRACHVCGWATRDGTQLPGWCGRCRGRTIADVADLPELYRTLAVQLAPGATGERQRVGGSRTPPLPYRVDVANLRGPATVGTLDGDDQHGALSIATVLAAVRLAIREGCDLPADTRTGRTDTGTGIDRDAKFVMAWLDRYAETADPEAVASVADTIHDTRQRAWRTVGYNAHRIRLGPCPQDIGDGQRCDRELWIDPVLDDSARCDDCGTIYERRYFLWLRRMAGTEETA
jgi:hypothetical protein